MVISTFNPSKSQITNQNKNKTKRLHNFSQMDSAAYPVHLSSRLAVDYAQILFEKDSQVEASSVILNANLNQPELLISEGLDFFQVQTLTQRAIEGLRNELKDPDTRKDRSKAGFSEDHYMLANLVGILTAEVVIIKHTLESGGEMEAGEVVSIAKEKALTNANSAVHKLFLRVSNSFKGGLGALRTLAKEKCATILATAVDFIFTNYQYDQVLINLPVTDAQLTKFKQDMQDILLPCVQVAFEYARIESKTDSFSESNTAVAAEKLVHAYLVASSCIQTVSPEQRQKAVSLFTSGKTVDLWWQWAELIRIGITCSREAEARYNSDRICTLAEGNESFSAIKRRTPQSPFARNEFEIENQGRGHSKACAMIEDVSIELFKKIKFTTLHPGDTYTLGGYVYAYSKVLNEILPIYKEAIDANPNEYITPVYGFVNGEIMPDPIYNRTHSSISHTRIHYQLVLWCDDFRTGTQCTSTRTVCVYPQSNRKQIVSLIDIGNSDLWIAYRGRRMTVSLMYTPSPEFMTPVFSPMLYKKLSLRNGAEKKNEMSIYSLLDGVQLLTCSRTNERHSLLLIDRIHIHQYRNMEVLWSFPDGSFVLEAVGRTIVTGPLCDAIRQHMVPSTAFTLYVDNSDHLFLREATFIRRLCDGHIVWEWYVGLSPDSQTGFAPIITHYMPWTVGTVHTETEDGFSSFRTNANSPDDLIAKMNELLAFRGWEKCVYYGSQPILVPGAKRKRVRAHAMESQPRAPVPRYSSALTVPVFSRTESYALERSTPVAEDELDSILRVPSTDYTPGPCVTVPETPGFVDASLSPRHDVPVPPSPATWLGEMDLSCL